MGAPLALHQRVPDEEVARHLRVDPAVVHRPVGDDGDAEQRHLLQRHHRAALLLPVRLAVRALEQVGADLLGPCRVEARVHPAPTAATVSTSSAAITYSGGFLNSADPGKIANRVPRAPW